MTQILQPGSVVAWSGDDDPATIDDTFSNGTWQGLWPRLCYHYATTGARDAELAGLSPTDTAMAYVQDINTFFAWNGTAWKPVGGRRANGTVTTAAILLNATASYSVTFPVGLFTSAPKVQVSTNYTRLNVGYASVTTSGFTINATNYSNADAGTPSQITWTAEQL